MLLSVNLKFPNHITSMISFYYHVKACGDVKNESVKSLKQFSEILIILQKRHIQGALYRKVTKYATNNAFISPKSLIQ